MRTHVIPAYNREMDDPQSAASGDVGTAAWEALLRAHAAVVPRLAREVRDAVGLPLSWYDVLLELNRAPQRRLRMQQLGERVVLSRTRVSRIVDDLVAAGLVTRSLDPADGRAVLVSLTPQGRRALRETAPVYLRAIDRHFTTHLTAAEITAIRHGLERILRADGPASDADD